MSTSTTHNTGNGGILLLIFIPLVLAVSVWLFICYSFARLGASLRSTKITMFPAGLFLGNFFAAPVFICFGWLLALFTGNTDMANYVVGKTSELALLSWLLNDPFTIPVWHMVVYQSVVWLTFGKRINNWLATFVYNAAVDHANSAH